MSLLNSIYASFQNKQLAVCPVTVWSWWVFWNLTEMVTNAPNVVSTFYIKKKGNNIMHLWKSLWSIKTSHQLSSMSPVLNVLKCHMLVFILIYLLLEKGSLCLHMGWKSSFPFTFVVTVLEFDLLAWPKISHHLPVDLQLSTQICCLRLLL